MPRSKVFLSHSSEDKSFVDRLAFDLERINVGVWYDKWELRVGDSIIDRIEQGIESHDFLIIVLSPASVKSHWVKRELNMALMRELSEKKVVVLPILLEECKLPGFISDKKYADFRESYENGLEQLLIALSPDSRAGILISRDFRTAQYLLSGLTATDQHGTNTLNAVQFAYAYRFRHELKTYLSLEEKRLIFWSAVCFKKANPTTPYFLHTTTPIWGLIDDTDDQIRRKWVIDGLSGVLYGYLLPYYDWASEQDKEHSIRTLMEATVIYQGLDNVLFAKTEIPPGNDFFFLKALAKEDPTFFDEYLPEKLDEDHPFTPATIEALAYLSNPKDDQFYFSFLNSKPETAFGAFKGLVHLGRPSAVRFLRERVQTNDAPLSPEMLDAAFGLLSKPFFVLALKEWLEECSDTYNRVRILAALANAGSIEKDAAYEAIEFVAKNIDPGRQSELLPILVRILGEFDEDRENVLEKFLQSKNPIVCEAAIFSLARVHKTMATDTLDEFLSAKSETIIAATIEALAKISSTSAYGKISKFAKHRSPLIRSSFFRALRIIQPADWRVYLELGINESHPLVRLSAARSLSVIARSDLLHGWLEQKEMDNLFRICADERLFARLPFLPSWLEDPEPFDRNLARLPARLTNLDTDVIRIDTNLNLNRTIDVLLGKYVS
jgi:hypothetical protein